MNRSEKIKDLQKRVRELESILRAYGEKCASEVDDSVWYLKTRKDYALYEATIREFDRRLSDLEKNPQTVQLCGKIDLGDLVAKVEKCFPPKVYCKTCKHVGTRTTMTFNYPFMEYSENYCSHPKNTTAMHTAYDKTDLHPEISECNGGNDCGLWEAK